MERIAIFAALQWECRSAVRPLRQVRRSRLGPFTVWQGSARRYEVWVVKTGIGMERAAAAVDAVGDLTRFALVMSTGCAGGLSLQLAAGDLVLATAIVCESAPTGRATHPALRAQALRIADAAGLRVSEGTVVCSATALASAAAKRAAAAGGAIAVEMEAEPIAARATRAGVPFLSVRAILDPAADELCIPDVLADATTGNVRPLAAARYLAAHPNAIPQLIGLRRLQRAARESLERFFEHWLSAGE
jgi:nucleoside phosphorylase